MVKLSVIMPIFNAKQFLEPTIESILNQDFKDFELLLIDDGSTDGTTEICEKYAKHDKRVEFYKKANEGVSKTRNLGIEKATGEFIYFVDADDYVESNMFTILMNNIQNNNADISMCGYRIIEEKSTIEYYGTNKQYSYNKHEAIKIFLKEEQFGVALWNKIFRKKVIEDLRFDEKLRINEDKWFLINAILNSDKIIYKDDILYSYIKRTSSATSGKFSRRFMDVLDVNNRIINLMKNYDEESKRLASVNALINNMIVYRKLIFSKNYREYEKEKRIIRENIVKKENISLNKYLNKFNLLEFILINKFNILYKPAIYILKKNNIVKKIKNKYIRRKI